MVFISAHLPLCPCRGGFLLAATLRQHVLPPRSSASLYDPTDDEWMSESEGKLTCMFSGNGVVVGGGSGSNGFP